MLKGFASAAIAALLLAGHIEAQVIEQVLVNVNGDILTLSDFERLQVDALRERRELAAVAPNSPQFAQAVAEVTPQLILGAVDELLWVQRAREHGWQMTKEQVTTIISDIRKQNGLEDDAAFHKALQSEGMSEEQLRRDIERRNLVQQAQTVDVAEKISVTNEEIRAFYETNPALFTTSPEITLREIVIAVPVTDKGINVAQEEEARAKAEDVRKRLLAGEPFTRLVTEVSTSTTKNNGGLLPPIKPEDLAPELRDMFDAMQVGDISDVKHTTRGYQIFKLESRSETKIRTVDEARGEIVRRIADQKGQGEMVRYLEKLRSQAKIIWRHDELEKAYERALADRRQKAGLTPEPTPKS